MTNRLEDLSKFRERNLAEPSAKHPANASPQLHLPDHLGHVGHLRRPVGPVRPVRPVSPVRPVRPVRHDSPDDS